MRRITLSEKRDAKGKLTDWALAVNAMVDAGCDCEEDEPGTCLLCLCERAMVQERKRAEKAEARIAELERVDVPCPDCGGSGRWHRPACRVDGIDYPAGEPICERCDGTGKEPTTMPAAELAALRRVATCAREVDDWQAKLVAPGGLNPPGYCPPLERLRAALIKLLAQAKATIPAAELHAGEEICAITRAREEGRRAGLEEAAKACEAGAAEREAQRRQLCKRRRFDSAGIRADQREECMRCAAAIRALAALEEEDHDGE